MEDATQAEDKTSAVEQPTITEDNGQVEDNTSAVEDATQAENNTSAVTEPTITEGNATSEPRATGQGTSPPLRLNLVPRQQIKLLAPPLLLANASALNALSAPNVDVDIISTNIASADEALPAEQQGAKPTLANKASGVAATEITDTLDQTTSPEESLGAKISNEIDSAASAVAGLSVSNSKVENNQITNIQNVINNIAISSAQGGANSQNIAPANIQGGYRKPQGPDCEFCQAVGESICHWVIQMKSISQ